MHYLSQFAGELHYPFCGRDRKAAAATAGSKKGLGEDSGSRDGGRNQLFYAFKPKVGEALCIFSEDNVRNLPALCLERLSSSAMCLSLCS